MNLTPAMVQQLAPKVYKALDHAVRRPARRKGPRVITIPEHKASHIHIVQDLFSMYICSADHA